MKLSLHIFLFMISISLFGAPPPVKLKIDRPFPLGFRSVEEAQITMENTRIHDGHLIDSRHRRYEILYHSHIIARAPFGWKARNITIQKLHLEPAPKGYNPSRLVGVSLKLTRQRGKPVICQRRDGKPLRPWETEFLTLFFPLPEKMNPDIFDPPHPVSPGAKWTIPQTSLKPLLQPLLSAEPGQRLSRFAAEMRYFRTVSIGKTSCYQIGGLVTFQLHSADSSRHSTVSLTLGLDLPVDQEQPPRRLYRLLQTEISRDRQGHRLILRQVIEHELRITPQ
ncbi:MAG: hypothetical protein D6820_12640 [Lentisphaerae bacterium]|nr:MAG: hypothetical protein D6820_12640 [Lentisphaerota bacterium]